MTTPFNENQIVAILRSSTLTAFDGARDVSSNDKYHNEVVRESILNSICSSNARLTVDETLLVNCRGYLGSIESHPEHKELLVVSGHYGGSEENDGEDAGMYTFWMNRSSLRDSLVRIPRAANPVAFFDAMVKDNSPVRALVNTMR